MRVSWSSKLLLYGWQCIRFWHAGTCNEEHLLSTPDKRLEELDWNDRFADSLSLSDDGAPEHSPQISPASVLPTAAASPMKVAQLKTSQLWLQRYSHCSTVCFTMTIHSCAHALLT